MRTRYRPPLKTCLGGLTHGSYVRNAGKASTTAGKNKWTDACCAATAREKGIMRKFLKSKWKQRVAHRNLRGPLAGVSNSGRNSVVSSR